MSAVEAGHEEHHHTEAGTRIKIFLEKFKASSPVFPNDFHSIAKVPQSATVQEALHKMITCKVGAVVVTSNKFGTPIYTFSMEDAVSLLLKAVTKEDLTKSFLSSFLHGGDDAHALAKKTLEEVEDSTDYDLDPCYTLTKDQSLPDAVNLMKEKGAHRVIVYDDYQHLKLTNLITQSRIMSFINALIDTEPQGKKTIAELGLAEGKLIHTVGEKELAYDAFKCMVDNKVSAVPVMKTDGSMIGVISFTDFKLIGYDMHAWRDYLSLTCSEFLHKVLTHDEYKRQTTVARRTSMWSSALDETPRVVWISKDDTLEAAVNLMVANKIHRVFVCEAPTPETHGRPKPTGVVSLLDILRIVA